MNVEENNQKNLLDSEQNYILIKCVTAEKTTHQRCQKDAKE